MLDRRINLRLVLIIVVALIFIVPYWQGADINSLKNISTSKPSSAVVDKDDYSNIGSTRPARGSNIIGSHDVVDWIHHASEYTPDDGWRVVYSQSTKDRKYVHVDFAGDDTYNVNLIPHPSEKDRWIVIAQSHEYRDDINSSEQVVCIARLVNDVLHCDKWPEALPVAISIDGKCTDQWAYTNMRRGPRDARVFYGPEYPYIIYGSQSQKGCLGLWVQNLWMLLDGAKHPPDTFARGAVEIERPRPPTQLEKNYFLFWDRNDTMFAHYDVYPHRAFSQIRYDGSAARGFLGSEGVDFAQDSAEHDNTCIEKTFPKINSDAGDGIHQGTNSLSVTMCKRADPACIPSNDNTFVLHIMQFKSVYQMHGVYRPIPILFRQRFPHELYAVASKPVFYHGIDELTERSNSRVFNVMFPDLSIPKGYPEQVYTTSISWKNNDQTYHGFIDDVLWIGFGVEDTRSGAIDVLASDLLQDLQFC